jgi:hypothetical protein
MLSFLKTNIRIQKKTKTKKTYGQGDQKYKEKEIRDQSTKQLRGEGREKKKSLHKIKLLKFLDKKARKY